MERFHYFRDSRRWPNVVFCRLRFRGEMDRQLAVEAMKRIIGRHPLLGARVRRGRAGKLSWSNPVFDITPAAKWHTGSAPALDPNRLAIDPWIDLDSQSAVQMHGFVRPGESEVVVAVHHAATDGLGAMAALHEWLVTYANMSAGRKPEERLRLLQPSLLARRGRIGLLQKPIATLPLQWIAMLGAANFFFRKIAPLAGAQQVTRESAAAVQPVYVSRQLPQAEQALLDSMATATNVTVNDLLLSQLFLAVRQWQSARGLGNELDRLRIIVPMNIRGMPDRRMPACNRVTMLYLDRHEKDFASPGSLHHGINYEMSVIRRLQLETTFLVVLRCMGKVPGWIRRVCRRHRCLATTVLTNLGAPLARSLLPDEDGRLVVGDLTLEQLELIPPVYDLMPAVFLLSSYAGQTRLVCRYDPLVLDRADADELLDNVMQRLQHVGRAEAE